MFLKSSLSKLDEILSLVNALHFFPIVYEPSTLQDTLLTTLSFVNINSLSALSLSLLSFEAPLEPSILNLMKLISLCIPLLLIAVNPTS